MGPVAHAAPPDVPKVPDVPDVPAQRLPVLSRPQGQRSPLGGLPHRWGFNADAFFVPRETGPKTAAQSRKTPNAASAMPNGINKRKDSRAESSEPVFPQVGMVVQAWRAAFKTLSGPRPANPHTAGLQRACARSTSRMAALIPFGHRSNSAPPGEYRSQDSDSPARCSYWL